MTQINYNEVAQEVVNSNIHYLLVGYTYEEFKAMNDGSKGCYSAQVMSIIRRNEQALKDAWNNDTRRIEVGTPCTINYFSDRRAATIVGVEYGKSGNNKGKVVKVRVRFNETKCEDYYASKYTITDELYGEEITYTKRRNKRFVEEGSTSQDPSTTLSIGFRHHFIDPSF